MASVKDGVEVQLCNMHLSAWCWRGVNDVIADSTVAEMTVNTVLQLPPVNRCCVGSCYASCTNIACLQGKLVSSSIYCVRCNKFWTWWRRWDHSYCTNNRIAPLHIEWKLVITLHVEILFFGVWTRASVVAAAGRNLLRSFESDT